MKRRASHYDGIGGRVALPTHEKKILIVAAFMATNKGSSFGVVDTARTLHDALTVRSN